MGYNASPSDTSDLLGPPGEAQSVANDVLFRLRICHAPRHTADVPHAKDTHRAVAGEEESINGERRQTVQATMEDDEGLVSWVVSIGHILDHLLMPLGPVGVLPSSIGHAR